MTTSRYLTRYLQCWSMKTFFLIYCISVNIWYVPKHLCSHFSLIFTAHWLSLHNVMYNVVLYYGKIKPSFSILILFCKYRRYNSEQPYWCFQFLYLSVCASPTLPTVWFTITATSMGIPLVWECKCSHFVFNSTTLLFNLSFLWLQCERMFELKCSYWFFIIFMSLIT